MLPWISGSSSTKPIGGIRAPPMDAATIGPFVRTICVRTDSGRRMMCKVKHLSDKTRLPSTIGTWSRIAQPSNLQTTIASLRTSCAALGPDSLSDAMGGHAGSGKFVHCSSLLCFRESETCLEIEQNC